MPADDATADDSVRADGIAARVVAAPSSPSLACVVLMYTPPKDALPDMAGGRWPPARPQLSNTGAEPLGRALVSIGQYSIVIPVRGELKTNRTYELSVSGFYFYSSPHWVDTRILP